MIKNNNITMEELMNRTDIKVSPAFGEVKNMYI